MHRVFHVLFIIFALSIVSNSRGFENASRNPWTTSKDRTTVVSHRRSRSTSRPEPINCKLMGWSLWSPCNSCTDKKFRFRYMEQPSQFGGSECVESLWDKLTCPTSTAQCLEADYCGDSFTCRESGRCISQSLRCNDEQDCSDGSDEEGCAQVTSRNDKCSTLQPIPGAPRGTQGFNVLTGDFVDQVLDYRYYGGLCEYVYNGEWRRMTYDAFCEKLGYDDEEKNYRKPFNYHTYHFVAEATSEGSQEYYSDMLSLVKARKTENSFNLGITVAVENFEIGARGSEESTISKRLTQSNKQDLGFVRLRSKVQTARFKMRSDGLMLHEDMYMSLMELPESYNFGMYSRFLNTFGTHYVTEGLMGGTLEYILVVNKTSMERSSVTGEQFGSCIGGSIGLPIPFKGGELDLKLSGDTCRKESDYLNDQKSGSNFIEDIYTLVKGGVTHNAGVLLTIRDPESYKKWGASLKYNPVLIQYETMPIYELVRASTAAGHVGERLSHLRRAWDEYLLQFHSCRCAPCRHGGVPFLAGTSCKCLCKEGYYGQACEETLRNSASPKFHSIFSFLIPTQTPRTDGAWSCWGAWSSCWSGSKTRTRACTNPSPDGGGAPCLGSDSQRRNC